MPCQTGNLQWSYQDPKSCAKVQIIKTSCGLSIYKNYVIMYIFYILYMPFCKL